VPHTKQQLELLLDQAGVTPRRLWGQHFLIDLNLMRLLVDAAQLQGNETVLEVGTGTGSLTDLLAPRVGRVITAEIDKALAAIAAQELKRHNNVTLFHTDILSSKSTIYNKVLEAVAAGLTELKGPFVLIANLPYQVSAPLMINLVLGDLTCQAMFVTVQLEVANRMTATPGTKEYGPLSILLQAAGRVRQFRKIKPTAFWPIPNVYSAMISWQRDEKLRAQIRDIQALKSIVDMLLGHRRKTIKSCLSLGKIEYNPVQVTEELHIDLTARAETLPVEKYVQLANWYSSLDQGKTPK
jgi:16S rRNA (adenine1518-N6/adenine1519-N6)-dimethyltransferase